MNRHVGKSTSRTDAVAIDVVGLWTMTLRESEAVAVTVLSVIAAGQVDMLGCRFFVRGDVYLFVSVKTQLEAAADRVEPVSQCWIIKYGQGNNAVACSWVLTR